ncbi:hypothetical protein GCM10010532_031600 [Dactylosporangium siamense]|uniref:Uncharacterized protein n=2 Tax=Dactylosporangium siamense TaxID=685454 RepID=A0A919PH79_9ACTN|nr:hypothetical protein Dsi01nite_019300 [Dactylosporangium siamense]
MTVLADIPTVSRRRVAVRSAAMRRVLGWILPVLITAAVAVYVGGVVTGRWDANPELGSGANAAPYPESTDPEQRKAQAELCPLIDRPDVYGLVEPAGKSKGTGTSYLRDTDWHQCSVSLPTSVLRLAVGHDRTTIAAYQKLFPEAQPRTVLGRPALWTAGKSMIVNSPWQEATLLIAWNRADTGGMVELTILRTKLNPADEGTLTQIAERQVPGVPGWTN